jgi:N-methylhydantoinase B
VQGGEDAKPGRFTVLKAATGQELIADKENDYQLEPGDIVRVETGGGGGYGPPSARTIDLIQRDIDAGYVSRQTAERDYGVKIGPDGKVQR